MLVISPDSSGLSRIFALRQFAGSLCQSVVLCPLAGLWGDTDQLELDAFAVDVDLPPLVRADHPVIDRSPELVRTLGNPALTMAVEGDAVDLGTNL